MQALSTIHSRFVPLQMENVDTDQIIPARFLKSNYEGWFWKEPVSRLAL